jgi:hypothetical protein
MDRAVLLALLGIPILVIIHIALFWQPMPLGGEMFWTASRYVERFQLRGHWRSPESTLPSHFAIERAAQGS